MGGDFALPTPAPAGYVIVSDAEREEFGIPRRAMKARANWEA